MLNRDTVQALSKDSKADMMSVHSIKLAPASALRMGLPLVIAMLVSIVVFRSGLAELVNRWIRQEEYSHGFLIPVVAAWLLWTRRDALVASIGRPAWTGPVLIGLAVAMHVAGELGAIFILSQVGFIVALIGIVLAAGGYSLLKVTFVPIAFLAFAIPLPYFIEANLTLQLQLISSELGAFLIGLLGIPVYLEGNVIDLGTYKLLVVEACSGLRYLFPLMSLAFLAAYLSRAPIWQRVLMFLSSIPITIAMNSFRIALIGFTMDRWGPRMAEGVLHYFEGWIIFIACAGILVLEILLLAWLSGKSFSEVFDVPEVRPSLPPGNGTAASAGHWAIAASLGMLVAAGVTVSFISGRPEIAPERTRFAAFPMRIGEWHGYPSMLDDETERGLGVDDYILSNYLRPGTAAINLYVAYYASQRTGLSPHSPSVCLPGGGWLITRFERTSYANSGIELPLNRVIIDQGAKRQLVYYWFDERGRKIANEWWAKWYLLADSITMNRTDGALVRLTTSILPGESEREADARLRSFMRDLVPSLTAYLPGDTSPQRKAALHSPLGGQS